MSDVSPVHARTCWCGAAALLPFSPGYSRCSECGTLVSRYHHDGDVSRVGADEVGLYGRDYWHARMQATLGVGDIQTRARTDLVDRCPHWLRAVLRISEPPARVLELGAAHGGFVALLRLAGFDASGLELSPAIVATARALFDVPMLQGPIEDQDIPPDSLDLIVAMDVLEHLPDPRGTMRRAVDLLRPEGALVIQTPCYPAPASLADLEAAGHRFVEMLLQQEHLYLFSADSVRRFFASLGCPHLTFEPARFSDYDMLITVGRAPLAVRSVEAQAEVMSRAPGGRLALAMLDLYERAEDPGGHAARAALLADVAHLTSKLAASEIDRDERLRVIEQQGNALEGTRRLAADVEFLRARLRESEADRAGRLAVIEQQGAELGQVIALRADIEFLTRRLADSEADRAARLAVIQDQGAKLGELDGLRAAVEDLSNRLTTCEQDRAARLDVIVRQGEEIGRLQQPRSEGSSTPEPPKGAG